MLKFILKIWPALLPIIIYTIWIFVFKKKRKKDYIDGEYKVVNEKPKNEEIGAFSLRNSSFVLVLFSTLLFIIISLIFIVITTKPIMQNQIEQPKIIVE